jgi:hypothetical protein
LGFPANFAEQLTYAEQALSGAVASFEDVPTELAAGDYGVVTYAIITGVHFATIALLKISFSARPHRIRAILTD